MKYLPLIWAGLWRRPVRTTLTLLSVVTAFFLFGVLQGVNSGLNSVFDLMNVSRLRVSSRANFGQPLPIAHLSRIAALDGVAHVSPFSLVVGTYQKPGNILAALGVDVRAILASFPEMTTSPGAVEAMERTRTGAIVGAAIAERFGWKIGDRIPIQSFNVPRTDGSSNWVFDIVGTYDMAAHNWSTDVWVNFAYVDEARAQFRGTANQFLLRVKDADRAAKIARQIDAMFANSPAQTLTQNEKDSLQGQLSQVGDIGFVVNAIVGAVLFALLFLTSNTMMQSTRERISELAVLRVVGVPDLGVMGLILSEALFIGVSAALLGLAVATRAIPRIMERASADLGAIRMPGIVFFWGVVIAVAFALVSGLPPAVRAYRTNLVTALSGR